MVSMLHGMAGRRMHRYALTSILDVEDICGEVCVRIVRERPDADTAERRFLAPIMLDRVLKDQAKHRDAVKRSRRRVTLDDQVGRRDAVTRTDQVRSILDDLERHDEVAAAIARLKFFENMEYDEIAERLGLTPGKVETRWRTAKRWLKSKQASYDGSD